MLIMITLHVILGNSKFLFATSHIAILVLLGVIFLHLYSISLHPFDIHLLLAGIVYLFYVPFLFILIPLYAVCNIVDQTWGTRENVSIMVFLFIELNMKKK